MFHKSFMNALSHLTVEENILNETNQIIKAIIACQQNHRPKMQDESECYKCGRNESISKNCNSQNSRKLCSHCVKNRYFSENITGIIQIEQVFERTRPVHKNRKVKTFFNHKNTLDSDKPKRKYEFAMVSFTSVFLSVVDPRQKQKWILDSGATKHVCNSRDLFVAFEAHLG